MDTPFYHDDSPAVAAGYGHAAGYERYPGNKMLMGKKAMSLGGHHFPGGGGGGAAGGRDATLGLGGSSLMSSAAAAAAPPADLNLLKLASPDLEHLIIQSNAGLVGGGSAPNAANPFVYRGQATNEQEGFADGFVKALADLHKQNQLVGGGAMSPSSSCAAASLQASYQRNLMSAAAAAAAASDMPVYTNLGSYNPGQFSGGQMAYGGGPGPGGGGGGVGPPQPHTRGLDAPQTVPEVPHPPGEPMSPPSLSPIDMETQERIKAERKKLRNRIAASKCRKRKLERISRLEEKVKVLKNQNSDLAATAAMLREQVAQLKQKVMGHITNGCQIAVGSPAKPGGGGAGGGGGASAGKDASC